MTNSIFRQPWFTWDVLTSFRTAIHSAEDDLLEQEEELFGKMLTYFLSLEREIPAQLESALHFTSFCLSKNKLTHSQIYQDLWVLFMLGENKGGYFVEFGCCDGFFMSNSLLLEEKYGWDGIISEPNPKWFSSQAKSRGCHISNKCVYHETGKIIKMLAPIEMPELTRLKHIQPNDIHERNGNRDNYETIMVETISLVDLLSTYNAPKVIDYLSIDTEGSELEILSSFDFNQYRVKLITVEHAGEQKKREGIYNLLSSKGYSRWNTAISRWDDWYYLCDL